MRKDTNESFDAKLALKGIKYTRVNNYITSQTKIGFLCYKCNNIFQATPGNILSGWGCSHCAKNKKDTNKSFDAKLLLKGVKYTRVNDYKGSDIKSSFKCFVCNNIWDARPHDILRGSGCPKCAAPNKHRTNTVLLNLYLVNLNNEFLKVGITSESIQNRFKRISNISLKEVLLIKTGEEKIIKELEQSIHKNPDLEKYIPNIKFNGYTECYSLNMVSILKELIDGN